MLQSEGKEEIIYQGIGVSPGIAIAPVHVVARGCSIPDVYERSIVEDGEADGE